MDIIPGTRVKFTTDKGIQYGTVLVCTFGIAIVRLDKYPFGRAFVRESNLTIIGWIEVKYKGV